MEVPEQQERQEPQGHQEHVEIARAETERGELVLRERRTPSGPATLELRANGVFVMDTVEVATERALADERVRVVVADVATAVAEAREASYDLVLLDVDNGPHHLVHETNAALYRPPFLAGCRRVLRPGGALAIWSADRSPDLAAALATVFGDVDELAQEVRLQDRDERYWLYVARVPASGPGAVPGGVAAQ